MAHVIFETVSGPGGTGHYIEDFRCGGVKPLGGGEVTNRAKLCPKDIIRALESSTHGRAALKEYVGRKDAEAARKDAL